MNHDFPTDSPCHLPSSVQGRVRDTLYRWLWVRISPGGEWHVLGYRASDGVVYITSPIVAADPSNDRVLTHSGSTYYLDEQADAPDARLWAHLQYALDGWTAHAG